MENNITMEDLVMIRAEDLYTEIEKLDAILKELVNPFEKALIKAQILGLKLLLNIRQNQVATMRDDQLIKPKQQVKEVEAKKK
jgi:hypothetical protein